MSNDNVATVQRAYAAYGAGDMDGLFAELDPSVEWGHAAHPDIPWSGDFHGHEGVGKFFQSIGENADFLAFEPHTFIGDGDNVAVLGRETIKSKSTGKQYETEWVHAYTLKGGKVVRFREYTDTATIAEAFRK